MNECPCSGQKKCSASLSGLHPCGLALVSTASSKGVSLLTFPYNIDGVIQSDLNYSVVLNCLASYITPKPVLHWTLNGEPYMTGALLIIRRLSWENLGTYVCTAKNSQGQYPSDPVTISLPGESSTPTPDFCVLGCIEPSTKPPTLKPCRAKMPSHSSICLAEWGD